MAAALAGQAHRQPVIVVLAASATWVRIPVAPVEIVHLVQLLFLVGVAVQIKTGPGLLAGLVVVVAGSAVTMPGVPA